MPDPSDTPALRYDGRLVRFHVGLEDPADLIADLAHAFHAQSRP